MKQLGLRFDGSGATDGAGKTSVLSIISTLFVGGSRLLTNILLGRLGGSELLGLTQNLMSTASLAALLLPTSAGSAASRNIAFHRAEGDSDIAREVARFIAARALIATVVVAAGVFAIMLSVRSLGVQAALVALLLVLATCGHAVARGLHYGTGQVARLVRWEISASVIGLVAAGCLLGAGVRNAWVLAPFALVLLVFVIFSWPFGSGRQLPKALKRRIDRFMMLGVVGTLASSGFLQTSVLVATGLNGLEYAGQYAAALSLTTPVSLIAGAASLALFPAMAGDHGKGDDGAITRRTKDATRILITLMVGTVGMLSILSEIVTAVVWGAEFSESAPIFVLLLVAVSITAIGIPSVNALTSKSNSGMAVSASTSVFGFAVGAVAWVLLAPVLPDLAVPLGYLVGATVIAAVPYCIIWKTQRHSWGGQTILLLVTVGCVLAVVVLLGSFSAPWWLSVGLAAVFLIAWGIIRRNDVITVVLIARSFRRSEKAI